MKKLAFYGGSFNPPNNNHLQIAKEVIKKLNMDKVYFVPVGNYYKKDELINVEYRYNMLKILCENENKLGVLDIVKNEKQELKAIDTMKKIKTKYCNDDIYFIMGADNFVKIFQWKNYESILNDYKIIVIERNSVDLQSFLEVNKLLNKKNIFVIKIKNTNYDSTLIRTSFRNKTKINNEVNSKITEYILNNQLYN